MLLAHPCQESLGIKNLRLSGRQPILERLLQRAHPSFMLLKQPQPGPNHIAGRAITTALYLPIDEISEMLAKRYRRVLSHEPLHEMS